MTPPLRLAIALVRGWTRLYTWRLPAELRDARVDEIESDLWESTQGHPRGHATMLALHVLARMLLGIPDDLGWRAEHANALRGALSLGIALTLAVGAAAALWIVFVPRPVPLPPLPEAPSLRLLPRVLLDPPPPPPPPPPPCAPIGFPGGLQTNCLR